MVLLDALLARLDGMLHAGPGPVAAAAAACAAAGAAYLWLGGKRAAAAAGEKPEPPEASGLGVLAAYLLHGRHWDRFVRAKYGDCFSLTIHLGFTSKKFVVLAGPEASRFFHYTAALCFRTGFGDSVGKLMPDGLFSRDRVHFVSRAVSSNKFPAFVERIAELSREFLATLPDEGVGENIFTFLVDTIFQMQVRILYGDDMFKTPGMFERFREAFDVLDPGTKFTSIFGAICHLAGIGRGREAKARGTIVEIGRKLIEQRLAEPSDWESDPLRKYDLIGMATRDPEVRKPDGTLDDTELFAFFWGNLFAAVGNSAYAIGWIAYRLAKDANARERLLGEWRAAVRESGGKVTLEAVNRVEYGTGLVNEVIRTSTPGISFRRATAETEYLEKYRIPKGRLLCFIWNSINLNDEVFKDPMRFDPTRWDTEGKAPGESIVFGAGRHPCVGMKITHVEFKILACMLLDEFDIEPLGEPAINYKQVAGVFRPVRPVPFRFRRRASPKSK